MSNNRSKNTPAKKNGRPPAATMTDLQRELKNKILKYTSPYFEAVLEKQLELAGVKKLTKAVEVKEDKDPDSKEVEVFVPFTVQSTAVSSFIKLHTDTLKIVYGNDKDGTISNLADDEEDKETPKSATVSKLSLHMIRD